MAVICPDEGELVLAQLAFREAVVAARGYSLALFVNNVVPDADSTIADFTIASFTGYASLPIARTDFAAPATVGGKAVLQCSLNPITFTCTAGVGELVFGWLLFDDVTSDVLFVERLPAARTVEPGNPLLVNVSVSLRSEN